MRKFIIAAAAATALLSACGGDDGGDTAGVTTAEASATSAESAASTAVATTAAAGAAAAAAAAATATAGAVDVVLKEWSITTAQLKAGSVPLNVKNEGDFKHELAVIKGAFASLPKTSSGSVDVSALPSGAVLGEVEQLDGGSSGTLTVDLAAGDYTLICNITGGGSSHAARGQVLDVTVA